MNDRHVTANSVRPENSHPGHTQRMLSFLLALATAIFLPALFLPAPAMAQTPPVCAATGNEAVSSDQASYFAGATAQLRGAGFASLCTVTLDIYVPDGSVDSADYTSAADGTFSGAYPIGSVAGKYIFNAMEVGNQVASSEFTSGPAPTPQCDQTRHERIDANTSHYLPGDTVPLAGSGFAPGCEVLMTVNLPDGNQAGDRATTDATGNLAYSYTLGTTTGDYSIQAVTTDGAISLATTSFASGIFVVTDDTDYAPGDAVTFVGRGFQPNETISLVVHQTYPGGLPDRELSCVADELGAFVNSEFVVGPQDLNTSLSVTATGQSSGRSASTWFTDALAFVAGQKTVNQTTATTVGSLNAVYAAGPTVGNLLVAIVGAFGNGTTITAPLGWSTAINQPGTVNTPAQGIFYKISAGAADNSVTASFSPNTTGTISIQEFSGVRTSSNPLDGANSNTGTTAATSTGTLTPASSATTDLLIGGVTTASTSQTVTMNGVAANAFTAEIPTATVAGGAAGTQRVASQSADKKSSPAGSSTGWSASAAPNVGWRGQIAAFKAKTNTTTAISVSPATPVIQGATVTFTANVTPSSGPTGNVTFKDGASIISGCGAQPLSSGMATCVTTGLSAGTHSTISATYNGDPDFATSSSGSLTPAYVVAGPATSDCFRSNIAAGAWNVVGNWQEAKPTGSSCPTDSAAFVAATTVPTGAASGIEIQSGHVITVTAAASAANLTVDSGGSLVVNSGVALTNSGVTVNGSLQVNGTFTLSASTDMDVAAGGTATVSSGGTVNGNGGSGATRPNLFIEGTFTVASGGTLSTGGSGPMTVTVGASPALLDVQGSFTGSDVVSVFSGGTLNVPGTLTMGGGTLTEDGTVNIGGTASGMVGLPIASTGQVNLTGTGTLTLSSVSNLSVTGSLSLSGSAGVTVQSGNAVTVATINNGGNVTLAGTSTFTITCNSCSGDDLSVSSGGTLDIGPTAFVKGNGDLLVQVGANLKIGSPDGIVDGTTTLGNVRTSSADVYQAGANYSYTGATQNTGAALPTAVATLTIASSGPVTLSNAATQTVNGLLAVNSGAFDQGPTASLVATGGISVASGATYRNVGTGDLTLGAGVANAGTVQINGTTTACPEADAILIRSNVPGTQRAWSGAGTFDITDVDVKDQAGTAIITALSSTDSGNNGANWSIVSGCTIDTTPPDTTITGNPSNPSNSSSASFTFTGSDDQPGPLTFECQIDGGGFSVCVSPKSYPGPLSDASHTFDVRARDAANNVDLSPASFTWTIDTAPPDTIIDSGPTGTVNSNSATFTFHSTEAGSSFECQLDGGGFSSCSSGVSYGSLGDGGHTFDVQATDTAGNTDASPASQGWTVDTTAPETSVDSGPTGPTSSTSATFEFSSTEPGSSFECQLDGGGFSGCTSPQTYPGPLSEGGHTFEVKATDAVGNTDTTPATFSWLVDTTEPDTIIDSHPGDPTSTTSAAFTFHATEALSTLECQLDGSGFSLCTSPQNYPGPLSDGSHTFQVRALDAANNVDPTPASFTWMIDTAAPDTLIDSHPNDPTNSNNPSFTFHATEGSTFQCSLDGAAFEACSSPQDYIGLGEGDHTFDVEAIDSAGNTDPTPGHFEWTIDTTKPETTITSGPANGSTTSSTSATFEFTGSDNLSDPVDLIFECQLDGTGFAACASPVTYTGLAGGSHTFDVRAKDEAGNTDASPDTRTWTVDSTVPDTVIDTGPPASTSSTSASFTFHSTEAGGTFECKLDAGSFAACSSPASYSGLATGGHTFQVRATDGAGNTDATPASYAWTITAASTTYTFTGFFAPVDNGPLVNAATAGQAIPLKWNLMLNGQPVSDPASFVSVTTVLGSCGTSPSDAIETYSGGSGLQYLGNGNWQYNWKTPKTYAASCRTMTLTLADGSTHIAYFKFK